MGGESGDNLGDGKGKAIHGNGGAGDREGKNEYERREKECWEELARSRGA